MVSAAFNFHQFETALIKSPQPAPAHAPSPVNPKPSSRPTTPSEVERSLIPHSSEISRPQESFVPPMLSESKASDVLISSAEPASISAAASTHIDAAGLEYDFDNVNTRIGVGTYGSVFLGRYFGEHVAIKRIRIPSAASSVAADPFVSARNSEAIRQFAREIRRYERVNHPGIVRFFGVTLPPDSSALLVTEFMQGGSLGEAISVLRRSNTPIERSSSVRIAMQACGGLRALHSHGCTWGDAKPENILLSEAIDTNGVFPQRAEARIADFGLSRSVGQTLLGDTTLAGSGQPAGTYNYMAPEVFTGEDHESPQRAKSADIFSFGLVIYEMLTLRTPWKRLRMMEVYENVVRGDRPSWPVPTDSDFHEGISADLKEIVERCWDQDPDKRPSAEGVFEFLERISYSMMDIHGHDPRPVTDLTQPANVVAADAINTQGLVPVQSTMSTVVAIGDASVELPNMLESTTDSKTAIDDDGGEDSDSSVTAHPPTSRHNPTVSPVTSPEPRSKNKPIVVPASSTSSLRTKSQLMPVQKSKFLEDKGLEVISPKVGQDTLLASRDDRLGSMDLSGKVGTTFEDTQSMDQFKTNYQFASFSPNEFPKCDNQLDEFAMYTGKAVAKIIGKMEDDERDPDWTGSMNTSGGCPTGLTNAIALNNFPSKAILDGTSNSSSASLTRKRSKRLQQIIDQAAEAFLELRRREERTPPKQRKEAMERQAEEDARANLERDALKAIDEAREQNDFSLILEKVKEHRESLTVVKASFSALELYCKNEEMYFNICEEGGIEEFVSGATLHGNQDPALTISFFNSIRYLSEHYDDKVAHMVRGLGAPTLVVELLEHYKINVDVQIAGCESLAIIAGSSELSRSAVATLGGPRAVYQAMTKNNSSFRNVLLARAALKAVQSIAHNNEKAADFLVQAAALDTVSRAADVFTCDGLEGDILMALRAFAFYDDGRRNVIMRSGLKALTQIIVRNNEPEFLVQCCTCIRAIARWRDHECEEAMLQSSISERIVYLMQMSNDIPGEDGAKVAWYSSNACTFLASFGSRSRQRLRVVGAIETALHIMRVHMRNARVVHAATDALAELLKGEPEAKRHAERFNVANELNEALTRHYEVIKTRNAVQWTLEYLLTQQPQAVVPTHGRVYQHDPPPQVNLDNAEVPVQSGKERFSKFWPWNRRR